MTALWLGYAGLHIIVDILTLETPGDGKFFLQNSLRNLASSAIWASIFLGAWTLVRSRDRIGYVHVGVMFVIALTFALLRQGSDDLVWCGVGSPGCPSFDARLKYRFMTLPGVLAVTVNFFAISWAIRAMSLSAEHRRLVQLARSEMYRTQRRALQRHLRPHFLFNTMQSIGTLVFRDPDAATDMLLGLRRLLQHSARSDVVSEVPVVEEMEIIRLYLAVEKLRFEDRLEVQITVDEAAQEARIPPFILQPLVENAVHHAVAVRGRGCIRISVTRDVSRRCVNIVIEDSGAGRVTRSARGGVGLANVKARLQLLYGAGWTLNVHAMPSGSAVTMSIPEQARAVRFETPHE